MIGLTVNIAIFNVTRVGVLDVDFREDDGVALVNLEAKTSVANGDVRYQKYTIAVQNGAGTGPTASQKIARNGAPTNIFQDALVIVSQVNIPSGFTNLLAAWSNSANTTKALRRAAAETQGLSAGWIDSSLTGVVS